MPRQRRQCLAIRMRGFQLHLCVQRGPGMHLHHDCTGHLLVLPRHVLNGKSKRYRWCGSIPGKTGAPSSSSSTGTSPSVRRMYRTATRSAAPGAACSMMRKSVGSKVTLRPGGSMLGSAQVVTMFSLTFARSSSAPDTTSPFGRTAASGPTTGYAVGDVSVRGGGAPHRRCGAKKILKRRRRSS
jgi:hypothetical protein